jgi:hypothetical protein
MSTKQHNSHRGDGEPLHDTVAFETADVQVRPIYWYLFALALSVIASFFVCIFILKFLTNFVSKDEAPMPASRAMMGQDYHTLPPEPELQGVPGHETDPQQDMRNMLKTDGDANNTYKWIDKDGGVAQIPVKDAMKIIAEKGLPEVHAVAAEKTK